MALIAQNRKMPSNLSQKVLRAQWDRLAEESACVSAMGHEVQGLLPVDDTALHTSWHDLFIVGDQKICVEIQSAILSRTNSIRDIPSLHQLITEHASKCPLPATKSVATMHQLEKDQFELVVKQIEYDLQALRVAKSKRSTWENSIYHIKLQHKLDQHRKSQDAASWFMQNYVCIVHGDNCDDIMRKFQLHRSETINRLRLDSRACALWLFFELFSALPRSFLLMPFVLCESPGPRQTLFLSIGWLPAPSRTR